MAVCLVVGLLRGVAPAQKLSIHHYRTSDGLAQSTANCIHQDAKGYLWFGTSEGVSRFDGYHFTNYSTRDGLTNHFINAIVEDREGRIWVGTNGGGVSRLIDDPQEALPLHKSGSAATAKPKFINFRVSESRSSNRVNAMLFDREDNLWCVTDGGLYRAPAARNGALEFETIVPHDEVAERMSAFADSRGRLWFGMYTDLIQVVGGRIVKYGPADEVGRYPISSIVEDRDGRLLVANLHEVFEFIAPTDPVDRGRWERIPLTVKPDQNIVAMVASSTGALWVGTLTGLIKYRDHRQTLYTTAQGLCDNRILSLGEDGDGNLWVGTTDYGVCKLSGEMIVSFSKTEGLADDIVWKIIPGRDGRIYVSTEQSGFMEIVGGRAVPIRGSQSAPFNDVGPRLLQDSRGDWWIGTGQGLFRFQGPELQLQRGRKFTAADAISDARIMCMQDDSSGRVWIGSSDQNLYRYDPARSGPVVFQRIPLGAKLVRMISDRAGALWLGGVEQLDRLSGEKVTTFEPGEGLPETNLRAFFQDSRGWLWIGLRYKGVSVTKDPTATHPQFVNYSTGNGLASDAVWSIAEDDFGRVYFGTSKGLDRLDLATGRIRHFSSADGLAGDVITYCVKDGQGNIWVATAAGLSMLNPRAEPVANRPPPIYLSRIQVAGEDLPLAGRGAQIIPGLVLSASRNNLLVEYVGLDFLGEGELRYQYKLEGVDHDWSRPGEQRSVNYASLAPGSYRFLVRAISHEGVASLQPAVLEFRVLPPVWQRWWFLALVALLLGALAYAIHRYRLARLLEFERVRTRIATDLHDDIGASLSQIAILSEVVRQRAGGGNGQVAEPLSTIAGSSRELVDAMSDIVWAINPRKDHLRDLTQRMRRFASDTLSASNIDFHFSAPGADQDIKLGADVRRQVFLIFKEGVNNMVRHAGCSRAEVEFRIADGWLTLWLSDNGQGFDASQLSDGHGLLSMRARARELGGQLEIDSKKGHGTKLMMRIPVGHHRHVWRRRDSPPE